MFQNCPGSINHLSNHFSNWLCQNRDAAVPFHTPLGIIIMWKLHSKNFSFIVDQSWSLDLNSQYVHNHLLSTHNVYNIYYLTSEKTNNQRGWFKFLYFKESMCLKIWDHSYIAYFSSGKYEHMNWSFAIFKQQKFINGPPLLNSFHYFSIWTL